MSWRQKNNPEPFVAVNTTQLLCSNTHSSTTGSRADRKRRLTRFQNLVLNCIIYSPALHGVNEAQPH